MSVSILKVCEQINCVNKMVRCKKYWIFTLILVVLIYFSATIIYFGGKLFKHQGYPGYHHELPCAPGVQRPELVSTDHGLPNLPLTFELVHQSHPKLPRVLSLDGYSTLIRLLDLLDELFIMNNITYTMINGTLLGSYMFHDIVPWDNKVQWIVANTSRQSVLQITNDNGNFRGFSVRTMENSQIRVFFHASPKVVRDQWSDVAFVDIGFFVNTYEGFHMLDTSIVIDSDRAFPFHRRPFGPLWLPAPRNSRHILHAIYGRKPFACSKAVLDSKATVPYVMNKDNMSVNCTQLLSHYPYIKRLRRSEEVGMRESLILDRVSYYTVLVNEIGTTGIASERLPYSYEL